jgi:LETM1 and EF-hand domain-containing protein 1
LQNRYRFGRNGPSLFFVSRELSTEAPTSSGAPAGPPPGFNVEEAKKPLPNQTSEKLKKSDSSPLTQARSEIAHAQASVVETSKESELSTANDKVLGEKVKDEKKLTVWQKVKHGVQHFWDGTKLLGVEMKISWNLALKMAAGYELSRRERRQVCIH